MFLALCQLATNFVCQSNCVDHRVVGVQLDGPLGHDLGFLVALLFHELVALIDHQGELLLDFELHLLLPLDVLADAVVPFGQLDLRAVLLDDLLGLGDRPVDAAEELVAGGGVQAGLLDPLPRVFQHGQRALGVGFAHGAGVGLAVGQVGGDLPGQDLLPGGGLVGHRRAGRRAAAAASATAPRAVAGGLANAAP